MNEKPLVSVVLPTYNRGESVLNSINSVLEQTYQEIELIIVDDCSNDNTEEIIKNIKDDRIIYIKNKKNRGANYSRNKGIKLAKGDYIALEDSDDIWHKDKLKKQMNIMYTTQADIIYSYYNYIKNRIKTLYPFNIENYSKKEKNDNILETLLRNNIVTSATVLARKKCIIDVGLFDENFPRMQEWELCIRLAQKYKFFCIEEALVDIYFTQGSITSKSEYLIEAKSKMILKYAHIMQQYKCLNDFIYELLDDMVRLSLNDILLERFWRIFNNNINKQKLGEYGFKENSLKKITYTKFREKLYFDLSIKWISHYIDGKKVTDYLEMNGWNTVAIYGFGQFGKMLYEYINQENNVNVPIILDQKLYNDDSIDAMLVSVDAIETYKKYVNGIDCVIITPIFIYNKIKKELSYKINKPIISLMQLFEN